MQRVDLVLEHRRRDIAADRPLPGRSAPGRAAPVDDEHRESLIGEPLRFEERAGRSDHLLVSRSAIRDRAAPGAAALPGTCPCGNSTAARSAAIAKRHQADVERDRRRLGERLDARRPRDRRDAPTRECPVKSSPRRTSTVVPPARRARQTPPVVRSGRRLSHTVGARPRVDRRSRSARPTRRKARRRRRRRGRSRTSSSRGVTALRHRRQAVSHHRDRRSRRGCRQRDARGHRATMSTHASSRSSRSTDVSPVSGLTSRMRMVRWSRLCTTTSRPCSDQSARRHVLERVGIPPHGRRRAVEHR